MPSKLFVVLFVLLICSLLGAMTGQHLLFSVLWIVASVLGV